MKSRFAAAGLILASLGPAFGHRLDEYLQATTILVDKGSIQAQIRLTPGVAVFRFVMDIIDTDRDGVISQAEQRAYGERVLRDLSLSMDGNRLRLQLISANFEDTGQFKEGLGAIQFDFAATVPGGGPERKLVFENRHQSPIGAYLVNCLTPRDPDIRITGQSRNYQQSLYQLDYVEAGVRPVSLAWWTAGIAGVLLLARLLAVWRQRAARLAEKLP